MSKKIELIQEGSLRQAQYAHYKGETEAHVRMAKGYSRKHRAGSPRAYTRRAWKTAWEARRRLKGFREPKDTFQRIARTSMMGASKSKHWRKLMKRADKARLDPSIPYGINRAGRDPRFILTIGEQKMKHETLKEYLKAVRQSINEAAGMLTPQEVLTEWGKNAPTGNRAARLRSGTKRPPGQNVKLRSRGTRHQINHGSAPKPKTKTRTTGLAARAKAATEKAKTATNLRQRLRTATRSMRVAARSAMAG